MESKEIIDHHEHHTQLGAPGKQEARQYDCVICSLHGRQGVSLQGHSAHQGWSDPSYDYRLLQRQKLYLLQAIFQAQLERESLAQVCQAPHDAAT